MTLLALESWDAIATADLAAKGWTLGGNTTPTVTSSQSRTGANACVCFGSSSDSSTGKVTRTVPAAGEHATFICGAAVYRVLATGTVQTLMRFMSDAAVTSHVTLGVTVGGAIEARRGGVGGTLLGTSAAGVLPTGAWHYLEAKVLLSDTVGTVTVRVDGVAVLTLTGLDTKNAGTKTVLDSVTLSVAGASGTSSDQHYWDDVYIANGAGSVNNDFLGDLRVRALLPSGNGNSSQLVGSDSNSTDNYLLVDEATPSTADYVGSATLNEKDTYAFGDLPDASGTVLGVQINAYATKTDAAARNLALVTRSAGTDYDGSDVALALSTNAYVSQVRETDPATAVAWTRAGVDAAEFGVKVR